MISFHYVDKKLHNCSYLPESGDLLLFHNEKIVMPFILCLFLTLI